MSADSQLQHAQVRNLGIFASTFDSKVVAQSRAAFSLVD